MTIIKTMSQHNPQKLHNQAAHSLNKTASVRVGPLINIPATLHDLGYDPAPVLESKGFTLEQFKHPDYKLPFVPVSKLLAHCVEVTGCQHFGLMLGERSVPSHLGIAGYLLRVAPDVNTALRTLLNYLDLHDEGGVVTLNTINGVTHLGYTVQLPDAVALEQIYDLSVALACNIMRGLCGNKWKATEVLLMRKPPPEPSHYKKFFQAPIRFSSDESSVAFPTRCLSQSLAFADALLYEHLENEAKELRANKNIDLTYKLRQMLQQSLKKGDCTISRIAKLLNIHERKLNRQLHKEGTSFRKELEQIRYSTSQQLLSATNASLTDIAISIGYADTTTFIRAFKRWSGLTPAQWRSHRTKH